MEKKAKHMDGSARHFLKKGESNMEEQLYTYVSVIVEIAGHPNGRDIDRKIAAAAALRQAAIGEFPVVSVTVEQGEEPTRVPGFGHSYLCKGVCRCNTQPWSVLRYFGFHVTVAGAADDSVLRRYRLTEHAEVEVCRIQQAHFAGVETLQPISKGFAERHAHANAR